MKSRHLPRASFFWKLKKGLSKAGCKKGIKKRVHLLGRLGSDAVDGGGGCGGARGDGGERDPLKNS